MYTNTQKSMDQDWQTTAREPVQFFFYFNESGLLEKWPH